MRALDVQQLTNESFKPFGEVITQPTGEPEVDEKHMSYWHDLYKNHFDGDITLGFFQLRNREFVVRTMERHPKSCEIFVPVNGRAVMLFAPSGDNNDSEAKPDLAKAVAFMVDGTQQFLIREGVWHAGALPLGDKIDFLLVLPSVAIEDGFTDEKEIEEIFVRATKGDS